MKISVIIPALNEASSIRESIESCRAAGADEVVVADGNSQDATREIADELDATLVVSKPGRGIQLNAGVLASQGEVLLFLHADNRIDSEGCEQIRNQFRPEYAYGAFRQRIDHPSWKYRWIEKGNAARVTWRRMPYGDQGIFVWREIFDQVGGFPDIPLMEDVALCDQLKKKSRPLLLPGPIYVSARRWQTHGILRQTIRNWVLFSKYRMGVSAEALAEKYQIHRADREITNDVNKNEN